MQTFLAWVFFIWLIGFVFSWPFFWWKRTDRGASVYGRRIQATWHAAVWPYHLTRYFVDKNEQAKSAAQREQKRKDILGGGPLTPPPSSSGGHGSSIRDPFEKP